jgi:hypothetical protein
MRPSNKARVPVPAFEEIKDDHLSVLKPKLGLSLLILFGKFLNPERGLHGGRVGLSYNEGNVDDAGILEGCVNLEDGRPDDISPVVGKIKDGVHIQGVKAWETGDILGNGPKERIVDKMLVRSQIGVILKVLTYP